VSSAPSPAAVRVAHLITDLDVGGAERTLSNLVRHSDSSRVRHTVISMLPPGAMADDIRRAGCRVVSLNMARGIASPRPLWQAARLLRAERPHILQTWLYHADLLGILAGRLARVPAIVWNIRCSDMDFRCYPPSTARVVRWLRRLAAMPEAVVCNAEAGRTAHERLGFRPRRWDVIPNGFDIDAFRPSPEARSTLRAELGVAPATVMIGMVARFDPMKDHATFLRAAELLAFRHPGAHFVLAGRRVDPNNPAFAEFTRSIALGGRVHLLGERKDSARILAALDIATLSSAFGEGCPNVLGEAMACGTPCVATSVGDCASLIGPTGLVVPPRDPDALAAAWHDLLERPVAARERLGLAARARIAEHFSLNAVLERYLSLYEELAGRGTRRVERV